MLRGRDDTSGCQLLRGESPPHNPGSAPLLPPGVSIWKLALINSCFLPGRKFTSCTMDRVVIHHQCVSVDHWDPSRADVLVCVGSCRRSWSWSRCWEPGSSVGLPWLWSSLRGSTHFMKRSLKVRFTHTGVTVCFHNSVSLLQDTCSELLRIYFGSNVKGSVCRIWWHLVVECHVAAEQPSLHPPLPKMKENLW